MTVLSAVDRHDGGEPVVSTGREIAEGLGLDHLVLYVLAEGEDPDRARADIESIVESAIGSATEVEIRVATETAAGEMRGLPKERIAGRILNLADETDADYIVVGSRKSTPVGKVMLGSVAQMVLINAEVPVVAVQEE